jgi:hypothetical protein
MFRRAGIRPRSFNWEDFDRLYRIAATTFYELRDEYGLKNDRVANRSRRLPPRSPSADRHMARHDPERVADIPQNANHRNY